MEYISVFVCIYCVQLVLTCSSSLAAGVLTKDTDQERLEVKTWHLQ